MGAPYIYDISRLRVKWMRHILHMGRGEKQIEILVVIPEEKKRQRKLRHMWEDTIYVH